MFMFFSRVGYFWLWCSPSSMNQPSSWGLLLKALVDDCDVYLSLDDLEKNHVSLEADVASGKYDDVIRAGSELSNNLIDYKNAAKKPRGQRPRLLRQEIRLSWAGAWELSNIRTTYLRIGEKKTCAVWCYHDATPLSSQNFGCETAEHFDTHLLAMWWCIRVSWGWAVNAWTIMCSLDHALDQNQSCT